MHFIICINEFINLRYFSPLVYNTLLTFCFDCLDVANILLFWLGNMNYYELSIKPRKTKLLYYELLYMFYLNYLFSIKKMMVLESETGEEGRELLVTSIREGSIQSVQTASVLYRV
jgi:hypothetical protein